MVRYATRQKDGRQTGQKRDRRDSDVRNATLSRFGRQKRATRNRGLVTHQVSPVYRVLQWS